MKISNKKKVNSYMTFQLVTIAVLVCTIVAFRYFNFHFLSLLFVFITLLLLLYVKIKNRYIFEYENSGEVLSIKSYQWLAKGRKPSFEMPRKKILNSKIKKGIFKNYLVIIFSGSSGKTVKVAIDITFCSESQVNLLFNDITKNIIPGNQQYTAEKNDFV